MRQDIEGPYLRSGQVAEQAVADERVDQGGGGPLGDADGQSELGEANGL